MELVYNYVICKKCEYKYRFIGEKYPCPNCNEENSVENYKWPKEVKVCNRCNCVLATDDKGYYCNNKYCVSFGVYI